MILDSLLLFPKLVFDASLLFFALSFILAACLGVRAHFLGNSRTDPYSYYVGPKADDFAKRPHTAAGAGAPDYEPLTTPRLREMCKKAVEAEKVQALYCAAGGDSETEANAPHAASAAGAAGMVSAPSRSALANTRRPSTPPAAPYASSRGSDSEWAEVARSFTHQLRLFLGNDRGRAQGTAQLLGQGSDSRPSRATTANGPADAERIELRPHGQPLEV